MCVLPIQTDTKSDRSRSTAQTSVMGQVSMLSPKHHPWGAKGIPFNIWLKYGPLISLSQQENLPKKQ